MKRILGTGIIAGALAASALLGPAATQASANANGVTFKNNYSKKCLQADVYHKTVTMAKCNTNKKTQNWYFAAGGLIMTMAENDLCLRAHKKWEKVPSLAICTNQDVYQVWQYATTHNGKSTPIANPSTSYLKSVKGKALVGKRTTKKSQYFWKLVY